jgi:hypothetical protein
MRSLPIVCLLFIGCGRPDPVAPETDAQGATRVFALARNLETVQKTKQAMDAYQEIIFHFPNTPEARLASQRISQAQRAAIRKVATRRSR